MTLYSKRENQDTKSKSRVEKTRCQKDWFVFLDYKSHFFFRIVE